MLFKKNKKYFKKEVNTMISWKMHWNTHKCAFFQRWNCTPSPHLESWKHCTLFSCIARFEMNSKTVTRPSYNLSERLNWILSYFVGLPWHVHLQEGCVQSKANLSCGHGELPSNSAKPKLYWNIPKLHFLVTVLCFSKLQIMYLDSKTP